jgi:hypothetical protein
LLTSLSLSLRSLRLCGSILKKFIQKQVIPNQKMFATNNPTRAVAHPLPQGQRVGEGCNQYVALFFQVGITFSQKHQYKQF